MPVHQLDSGYTIGIRQAAIQLRLVGRKNYCRPHVTKVTLMINLT